jgi:hypothetical protein
MLGCRHAVLRCVALCLDWWLVFWCAALPTLDIAEGALNKLIDTYKLLLPELGGYLTHAGAKAVVSTARPILCSSMRDMMVRLSCASSATVACVVMRLWLKGDRASGPRTLAFDSVPYVCLWLMWCLLCR